MKRFILISFLLIGVNAFAQWPRIDSLKNALKLKLSDTTRLSLLVQLSDECDMKDILIYADPAVKLADQLLHKPSLRSIHHIVKNRKARALNNIGYISNNQGKISAALEFYHQSLRLREEIKDTAGIAQTLSNIAFIYNNQGHINKALECFEKSLKLREVTGDRQGYAYVLGNMGTIYKTQNKTKLARDHYEKALKIQNEINDKMGIAVSLNNLGALSRTQGEMSKALNNYMRCLEILEEFNDKLEMTTVLSNIGSIYLSDGKFNEARKYGNKSLQLSYELNFPENIRNSEDLMMRIDSASKDFKSALQHYKQYIIYRDRINNEETRKASIRSQLKYEFDKKEAVIRENQQRERAVNEAQHQFQQIVIWAVIIGLSLVMLFAVFMMRSLQTTRKQKLIIEEKQQEIIDSMEYAKWIQQSMLPTEKYIDRHMKILLQNKN